MKALPNFADPAEPQSSGELTLSLQEHEIGFYLPPGSELSGARLNLEHGALIDGRFYGEIKCRKGSLVIREGARVCGTFEADRVYIAGHVVSATGQRSTVTSRSMLAVGETAAVNADLQAVRWSMHTHRVWGQLLTMEEASPQA